MKCLVPTHGRIQYNAFGDKWTTCGEKWTTYGEKWTTCGENWAGDASFLPIGTTIMRTSIASILVILHLNV